MPRQNTGAPTSLSCVSQCHRRPLYFGQENSSLFGWLHTPLEAPQSNFGMVFCPPLGVDYVNTYPTLRHLADRLAARGIPVLRFDYSGTGNSSGFDVDPDRVNTWSHNIRSAMEALTQHAGCAHAGLLGVRIGATLATAVTHDAAVFCLALWGPVIRGSSYAREMRTMFLTGEWPQDEPLSESTNVEAGGFVFTPQTMQDLIGLNLDQMSPRTDYALFFGRDDFPGDKNAPASWSRPGMHIDQTVLPGFAGMVVAPHHSQHRYPYSALDHIERRITDIGVSIQEPPASARSECRTSSLMRGLSASAHPTVRESVFRFGPQGSRFGIISEPLDTAHDNSPWVVLLNSGALHTAGPNRLYVLLSRAIAHSGLRCIRVDFPGVGDSVVAPPHTENCSYQASNNDEVAALLTTLQRDRLAKHFVLMGLCSGAHASFHALLELKEQPILEAILINPLTFYWTEGMSLDDQPPVSRDAQNRIEKLNVWQHYKGRIRDPRSWRNLLSARSDVKKVVRAIFERVRIATVDGLGSWLGVPSRHPRPADPLNTDIRTIVKSGRKLTFVFSRTDPGYGLLMATAGVLIRHYLRKGNVRIWFIERTNHTFTGHTARRELIDSVTTHLIKRYQPRE